jgi:DNA topoisomerase-1
MGCKEKVLALVVKLLNSPTSALQRRHKKLYGSFGLTTMQDQHVKFEKSKVWFEFIGKKGIKHKMGLHSKKLVNLIKKCKDIPGQDLFQYYTPDGQHCCIGSSDVNNYLKAITGEDYTAKDFRPCGSVKALECFRKLERPESQTEYRRRVVEVLDEVASNLGNTRAVCKNIMYIPR